MHASVIIGKVASHKVRSKGKLYNEYIIRVPTKRAREIGLQPDNYYIMSLIPAEWYDLVDLRDNGYVYKNLPPEVKRHLDWLKKAQEEGIDMGPDARRREEKEG